jgi:RNA polymerase sigma factor (sigma-70 family)
MNSRSAANWDEFKNKADKLYRLLFYFAVGITSDEEQADMIVTEQLFQCWSKRDDPENLKVKQTLYVTIRNDCLDYVRKRKAANERDKQWVLENMSAEEDPFLHSGIVQAEMMQKIKEWVQMLPPQTREVIDGLYLKGIPAKELAMLLGKEVSTLHTLKYRGLRRLRELGKGHNLPLLFFLCMILNSIDKNF